LKADLMHSVQTYLATDGQVAAQVSGESAAGSQIALAP
jgi:hypothetical protein